MRTKKLGMVLLKSMENCQALGFQEKGKNVAVVLKSYLIKKHLKRNVLGTKSIYKQLAEDLTRVKG